MKISAGWTRKDGRPDYGSEGSQVTFSIDVSDELWLNESRRIELMKGARDLTVLARRTVEDEMRLVAAQVREARERAEAEGAARDAQRRAAEESSRRETGVRPAPQPVAALNGNGHHAAVAEGVWNDEAGRIDPMPQRAPVPQQATAPQRSAPPSRSAGGPPRRSGSQDGKPPTNARTFAGWMKHQADEVKTLVKDLMSQNEWGWQWTSLSDEEAMWLYGQVIEAGLLG